MSITVNQIASQCGVSRTTVLRALNGGSVSKETREKILAVAQENNYRPNLLARSLNHGRTMSLGVVTINVENLFFVQSLNVINKTADKKGYFTNIVVCEESSEMEQRLIQGLADRQVEGILISPIGKGKEFEKFLLSLHIPVVCMGNQVSEQITTVRVDEKQAAVDAFRLIASKGYRKIVFVCPPLQLEKKENIFAHKQRWKGFQEESRRHPEMETAVIGVGDYMKEAVEMLEGSSERIAFLCSGDTYALNLLRWAQQNGKKVPDDFGLMGFDDISILDYITPKLTTVSTNLEGVASSAVNELISQIDAGSYTPKTILLNYRILDRETL